MRELAQTIARLCAVTSDDPAREWFTILVRFAIALSEKLLSEKF
jgi:hypothetical protein